MDNLRRRLLATTATAAENNSNTADCETGNHAAVDNDDNDATSSKIIQEEEEKDDDNITYLDDTVGRLVELKYEDRINSKLKQYKLKPDVALEVFQGEQLLQESSLR
jgi:phage major head subunit gpT-like protein